MNDAVRSNHAESYQRIWRVIARIPVGNVATYGQIAKLAGLGRAARQVGYALRHSPSDLQLPWHRVINARGEIALPKNSDAFQQQKQRLTEEGVVFRHGRIDLKTYAWQTTDAQSVTHQCLDEWLWKFDDVE